MFKEYAEMGIQDAKKADSAMSLFIVAINGFDEIRKNISGERLKNILSGVEDSIKKSLRRAGDAVAKDTGEIIVIVSGCGKENVLNVINRLQQNLNDYLVKERLSEQIKLKIGYSTYPQDAETEEELIRIARK
jgi:diguanylate cyclase (GGDEF)-like protein